MKRLLCVLLSLATLLSFSAVSVVATTGNENPQIEATENWGPASDGIYYINNASDLLAFSVMANSNDTNKKFDGKTIKLTADIDLNPGVNLSVTVADDKTVTVPAQPTNVWIPIPELRGTFDGQGHTISGIYVKQTTTAHCGFIQTMTGASQIKNLAITNSVVYSEYENNDTSGNGAGLVGQIWDGSGSFHLVNIYSEMDVVVKRIGATSEVSTKNKYNAGGLIGRIGDTMTPQTDASGNITMYYSTIESCVYAGQVLVIGSDNKATQKINSASQIAGAGKNFESPASSGTWLGKVKVENCAFIGKLVADNGESNGEGKFQYVNVITTANTSNTEIKSSAFFIKNQYPKAVCDETSAATNFVYSSELKHLVPTYVAVMLDTTVFADNYMQLKKSAEADKMDLRIISEFAGIQAGYKEIGYLVSLTEQNPTVDTTGITKLSTDAVYDSLLANGELKTPTTGNKWLAMGIDAIPNTAFDTNIYVRAYAITKAGKIVYDETVTVKVSSALDVAASN